MAAEELIIKYPQIKTVSENFAIVAYGKLGGYELNYSSDLDVVFLHNNPSELVHYTTRLSQRIVHLLNTRTAAGVLYNVDTRLRPSGAAGLLVSHIDAFCQYQQESAWTWEHQALVRARIVCGDETIAQRFTALRTKILCTKRKLTQLQQDIAGMRQRMLENNPLLDLKHAEGGIIDSEFLVQFAVLAWSNKYPELATKTDNISIIEILAESGIIKSSMAQRFAEVYIKLRQLQNYVILRDVENDDLDLMPDNNFIRDLWQLWIGNGE
ncbi:unnamed protein product [marine sediment metagenome]|uniref:Glutamate-ammonia ligase adenylyltransferase repeated domain-containing protein n=1 Tax=marine sediment metagenome TaxID=412755 RepID=X1BZH5_9ZZZZ